MTAGLSSILRERDAGRRTFAPVGSGAQAYRHFVAGDRGASEWKLAGTTADGVRLEVRGCDLWTFRDGLVTRKDSFWKIVER